MPASGAKPRSAHWPDRAASRHRRRAHKVFVVVAVLLLVLPWFGYRYVRQWLPGGDAATAATTPAVVAAKPGRATAAVTAAPGATPVSPASAPDREETETRLAAVREGVMSGDEAMVSENVEALDQAARSAMLLVDRGSAVHRIQVRTLVREMPGVRAAGWIDPVNMLVVVSGSGMRSRATIDGVCDRLASRADASGIVVNVQDGTASTLAGTGILSGACPQAASAGGNRRLARAAPAGYGDDDPARQAEREARRAESMRILEQSTPALPAEVPITPPADEPIYLRLDPPPQPEPERDRDGAPAR